jgi:hypothetical protein
MTGAWRMSNRRSARSATAGKTDIGRVCRLADHFQLACLNLSHGLKWPAAWGRLQWTYHAIHAFVWNGLSVGETRIWILLRTLRPEHLCKT